MKLTRNGLTVLATAAFVVTAAPALAQNSVGEAIDDVENAATSAGNSIGNAADDLVDDDVNVSTTDASPAVTTTDDVNLSATDPSLSDLEVNETDMMVTNTTTTTVPDEDGGMGIWGLLGLAGLLSFLFTSRKKPAVHLDERRDHTTDTRI